MRRLRVPILGILATASLVSAQTPKPSPKPAKKEPPRVFTNDDLEAARKRPSNVQDLSATSGDSGNTPGGYANVPAAPEPSSEPTPTPPPSADEQLRQQIAGVEERIKSLDERAKQILWQYLQSTDTNEILALKAEQKQILEEIDSAKAELARLRGEQPTTPTPDPTPPPG